MAEGLTHDEQIQAFCGLTGATADQALQYLQLTSWDYEQAITHFYASQEDPEPEDDDDPELPEPTFQAPTAPPPLAYSGPVGQTLSGDTVPLVSSSTPNTASSSTKKSAGKKPPASGNSRFATLSDLNRSSSAAGRSQRHGDSDDDEDGDYDPSADNPQDFFAGGEKSGLAVQNPNNPNNQRDLNPTGAGGGDRGLVSGILRQAANEGRRRAAGNGSSDDSDTGPTTRSATRREAARFRGTGQTLGSEDVESTTVPNPAASLPRRPERVHRLLTFWRDGFSVEDGPLLRYDDPANREALENINQGRAPLSLMNLREGEAAEVEVVRKMEEDYRAPKRKAGGGAGFVGSGNRLGTEMPEISGVGGQQQSSSTTASSSTAATAAVTKTPTSGNQVPVDDSQPIVTLQIRRADGTRLTSRLNLTHTVGDVREFVNSGDASSRQRSWVLMTTFPSKRLEDPKLSLGDVPELKKGGVVVQRWE